MSNTYVPTTWKESRVKIFTKAEQKQTNAQNYRPISLNNSVEKNCETLVKNIVLKHVKNNSLFSENNDGVFAEVQIAYRTIHCTTDNLLTLYHLVTEAFQWSIMLGFICLDVEKAFDVVRRLRFQDKLRRIGVHKPVIKELTSQRIIFVKVNNSKRSTISTLAGVPQGSIIAPILFLVYVSGISDLSAQVSQSVDDLILYYRSCSCRIFQEKPQFSLDKLFKCCEKLKKKQ